MFLKTPIDFIVQSRDSPSVDGNVRVVTLYVKVLSDKFHEDSLDDAMLAGSSLAS